MYAWINCIHVILSHMFIIIHRFIICIVKWMKFRCKRRYYVYTEHITLNFGHSCCQSGKADEAFNMCLFKKKKKRGKIENLTQVSYSTRPHRPWPDHFLANQLMASGVKPTPERSLWLYQWFYQ